jgi:tetratricopeptide (TPR) repeat protein
VDQAIERGDATGLSHIVLAHLHLIRGEHQQAIDEAEQATRKRPSCDAAFVAKSNVLRYLGRTDEAVKMARHAIRITPLQDLVFPAILASAYHSAGRFEDAIKEVRSVLDRDPENSTRLLFLPPHWRHWEDRPKRTRSRPASLPWSPDSRSRSSWHKSLLSKARNAVT